MIIIGAIAATLFVLAFVTKRRFGVLGLGLCAGALLSTTLDGQLSSFLQSQNIALQPLTDAALAAIILTLLPSLLLLLGGPKYVTKRGQLLGAAGYSLLGVLLLLGPVSGALMLDSQARDVMQNIARLEPWLITAGVVLAVLDTMAAHGSKLPHSGKKHH